MPLRLLLISHAATSATRLAAFPKDEAIEASWEKRTAALASSLPRADQIYRAPERRTLETATALGLEAQSLDALRDLDHGRWAGDGFDAVLGREPEALGAWTSNPAAAPHGGESIEALIERLAPWLAERQRLGGRVIAVTHPAVIRAALVIVLGAPATSFWRIDIAPLTRVELRGDGRRWLLRAIAPWTERHPPTDPEVCETGGT